MKAFLQTVSVSLFVVACGLTDPVRDSVESTLSRPQLMAGGGDAQRGVVGEELQLPLSVLARSSDGRPLKDEPITFDVTSGSGVVEKSLAYTDRDGSASTRFSFGTTPGDAQVEAIWKTTFNGKELTLTVPFTLTAVPGAPQALEILSGESQCTAENSPFPEQLVVRAVDLFHNPLAGVTINAAITNGTVGGFSLAQGETSTDGTVSFDLTSGDAPPDSTVGAQVGKDQQYQTFGYPDADGQYRIDVTGWMPRLGENPVVVTFALYNDFVGYKEKEISFTLYPN